MSAAVIGSGAQTEPDQILYNANVMTVDAAQPRAQAVAVAGARFLAVGSNDEIGHLAKAGVRRVDIGARPSSPDSSMRTRIRPMRASGT